jgi:uncharacterized membrane protein
LGHNQQRHIVAASSTVYSAPLPTGEQLIKYKEAHPDAPERIIKMAETQAAHRQKIESKVIAWDVWRSTAGLFCAFIVVLAAIYASWNLIYQGHEVSGATMFGATIGSVVYSFIYGTKSKQPRPPN